MLVFKFIHAVAGLCAVADAFYLPGVAPNNYAEGDPIELFVNSMRPSMHHMVTFRASSANTLFSYDYYYPKFKFCQPFSGPEKQLELLGAIIFGDRIFNSPFELNMLKNKECVSLCSSEYDKKETQFVNRNIRAGYSYNWIVDGLPAARHVHEGDSSTDFYSPGFPMGFVDLEDFQVFLPGPPDYRHPSPVFKACHLPAPLVY